MHASFSSPAPASLAHGIADNARRLARTLQHAGFSAYVTGGAVRDMLLSIPAHDVDLATSATTADIIALFPGAVEAGGRFRIVLVPIDGQRIEIATLRPASADSASRQHCPHIAGSPAEDAAQRDFTINALYYDPGQERLTDFHGGMADLQDKVLRTIGNPDERFRDDPMIMLRAIRFAHRLGFSIASEAVASIDRHAALIAKVSPERLFAEVARQLTSGQAAGCMRDLCRHRLHAALLPELRKDLLDSQSSFTGLALQSVDDSLARGTRMSASFVFAALLWPQLKRAWDALQKNGWGVMPALERAAHDVCSAQSACLGIRERVAGDIHAIWSTQAYFAIGPHRAGADLDQHPRFRAGYNLFQLRCAAQEVDPELANAWSAQRRR